jgi:hypothetical protein
LQVPELKSGRLRPWSARLLYAYADALLAAGRAEEARDAFARAVAADPEGATDAAERLDELDGIEFEDLEDDDDLAEDDDLTDEEAAELEALEAAETDADPAEAEDDDDPGEDDDDLTGEATDGPADLAGEE